MFFVHSKASLKKKKTKSELYHFSPRLYFYINMTTQILNLQQVRPMTERFPKIEKETDKGNVS